MELTSKLQIEAMQPCQPGELVEEKRKNARNYGLRKSLTKKKGIVVVSIVIILYKTLRSTIYSLS